MKIREEKIIDNYQAITLTLSVLVQSRWSGKK
jgi:hypothetical protein